MAEHWRCGNGKSVRQCARIVEGTKEPSQEASRDGQPLADSIAGKGKPDSRAKRLERFFHKLDHEG